MNRKIVKLSIKRSLVEQQRIQREFLIFGMLEQITKIEQRSNFVASLLCRKK